MDILTNNIALIQKWYKEATLYEKQDKLSILLMDKRAGVQRIAKKIQKDMATDEKERNRLSVMSQYENEAYSNGYNYVIGVDEAGRGPLMGPVVAAAVILPKDCMIMGLDDSKKISEHKRNLLFDEIYQKALFIGVGMVSNIVIDKINILNATKKAMKIAIYDAMRDCQTDDRDKLLLIDAVKLTDINIRQKSIIKGDQKSISIAAASIVAKVTRDRWVYKQVELYPNYQFDKNKGYGTKVHIEALKKYGKCPIHRKSFIKKI